jgi:hypothetical protein
VCEGVVFIIGLGFDADTSTKTAEDIASAKAMRLKGSGRYRQCKEKWASAVLMGVTGFDGDDRGYWTFRGSMALVKTTWKSSCD